MEKEIFDVLDYRFYETDRTLQILLRNVSGEEREVRIVKREYQSIGLSFDTCRNKKYSLNPYLLFYRPAAAGGCGKSLFQR